MTEKRFEMVITGADGSFHYLDKVTNEKINSTLELENKLNELAEENEQLKEALKELKEIGDYQADRIQELNDENKQLKKMIFEFNEKAKRFINNPNERPIRTNEDYWVGVNNITSFLMERLNDRE